MSDETDQTAEIHFGFVRSEDRTIVQFADGPKQLPSHIIDGLGGLSELEKIADGLVNVTFAEFMEGFNAVMASRRVNDMQKTFIENHFGRLKLQLPFNN